LTTEVLTGSRLAEERAHACSQETAHTRAGDRGLGPPLVRRRPYCDPRLVPSPRPTGAWPRGRAIYLASWPSPRRCAARCRARGT